MAIKSEEKDSIKVEETKLWLSRQKPVIIGLNLTKDFENIAFEQEKWTPNLKNKTAAYHAMVVVGYNNDKGGEFELLNSHGPYWGDDGFIKISYEDYGALVKYAFVIDSIGAFPARNILAPTLPLEPTFGKASTTDLVIRRIQHSAKSFYFTTPTIHFNQAENYYTPSQGSWEEGSQYQLIVKNLFADRHLYVFSFDAQKKVISIWPLNKSQELKGLQQTEIHIPSEMNALEMNHVGKDYVVLLYSMQELSNFEERLQEFRGLSGNFKERMKIVFGDVLIDIPASDYKEGNIDAIHFENDIIERLKTLDCKKIVFIDACNSGKSTKSSINSLSEALLKIVGAANDFYIMTSSSAQQKSYENVEWENGAFTETLIEAFTNKPVDIGKDTLLQATTNDAYLTFGELFEFTKNRVSFLVGTKNKRQTPAINKTISELDWPIFSFEIN